MESHVKIKNQKEGKLIFSHYGLMWENPSHPSHVAQPVDLGGKQTVAWKPAPVTTGAGATS